jgi:hypothetical protein
MLREVRSRLGPLAAGMSKATIDYLFSTISGQEAPPEHGAQGRDARARLAALLARGDADIVVDLRKLNGSDEKCFDLFWDVAEGKIEELLQPRVRTNWMRCGSCRRSVHVTRLGV